MGLAVGLAIVAWGCGEDPLPCDAGALRSALEGAMPGDTVVAPSCTLEDVTIVVPPQVALVGAGTVLRGRGDVVTMRPGAELRSLRVEATDGRAIVTEGEHRLESLVVHIERGVGIRARGNGTWVSVEVHGAVDPMRPDLVPPGADRRTGHYPVVLDQGAFDWTDTTVLEGGPWGVIVQDAELVWAGGGIRNIVGTGLYAARATVTLERVEITALLQGIQPFPPYGVLATTGSTVNTDRVRVADSEGLGLLYSDSDGTHRELAVETARFGGLWLQEAATADVEASRFLLNRLAAIAAVDRSGLAVRSSEIRGTTTQRMLHGADSSVEAGDGILASQPAALSIVDTTIADNARVGVLIDDATVLDPADLRFTVSGDTLGAIVQGAAPADWDRNVVREGAVAVNDPAFGSTLALTGPVIAAARPEP